MQIKFDLKTNDYLSHYKRYYKKNMILFKPYIFIIAIVIVFFYVHYSDLTITSKPDNADVPKSVMTSIFWIRFIIYSSISIGFIFMIRYLIIQRLTNRIDSNPIYNGTFELVLRDEDLLVIRTNMKIEYSYKIFSKVETGNDYCILYFHSNKNMIIIPKNIDGYDQFVNEFKEKLNNKNGY